MKFKTILDLFLVNIKHLYYKITGQHQKIVPYKIVVELTTHCNSKCVTCDIWQIKKENLQKIDLIHFENFLISMGHNLKWLALTGGEVTNFREFPELTSLIKQHCPQLRILTFTTNGLLPKRILEYARMLKEEIHCDLFITISLDGDEDTHDRLRGIKGNYAKCMETYKLLKDAGIDCHFGITISEDNHSFVIKKYKDYRQKIKAVTTFHSGGIFLNAHNPITQPGDKKNLESLKMVYKQYQVSTLGEMLVKAYIKLAIIFLQNGRSNNIIPCDVGQSSAHLMANGDLHQCMFLPAIANIGNNFSMDSYQSQEARALLEEIKNDKCPHCWMSCYGPHNMLQSPIKTVTALLKN